jgi:hypothetical protein
MRRVIGRGRLDLQRFRIDRRNRGVRRGPRSDAPRFGGPEVVLLHAVFFPIPRPLVITKPTGA